jgi:hypothetical protein
MHMKWINNRVEESFTEFLFAIGISASCSGLETALLRVWRVKRCRSRYQVHERSPICMENSHIFGENMRINLPFPGFLS